VPSDQVIRFMRDVMLDENLERQVIAAEKAEEGFIPALCQVAARVGYGFTADEFAAVSLFDGPTLLAKLKALCILDGVELSQAELAAMSRPSPARAIGSGANSRSN
jgi:hypothetical protein